MKQLILFSVLLIFAGCKQLPELPAVISPYQIDIQQGNVVTQEMVAKLKPGMTRAQVRFVLGSPLIVDPFRTDRWDYVYMLQKQGKPVERRNITALFDNDKLVRIEGDVVALQPGPQPAAKSAPTENKAAPEKGFFGRMLDKLGF
jgi:outer membrane protein assembly factor BamE